jgi:hypothetical protein
VDDDSLKWYAHTSSLLTIYRTLGVGAVRVTLDWQPGETFPVGSGRTELQRAANAGRSVRVVLAVTRQAAEPPVDDVSRTSYCGFIANVLQRFPWIHDVAIWTEAAARARSSTRSATTRIPRRPPNHRRRTMRSARSTRATSTACCARFMPASPAVRSRCPVREG